MPKINGATLTLEETPRHDLKQYTVTISGALFVWCFEDSTYEQLGITDRKSELSVISSENNINMANAVLRGVRDKYIIIGSFDLAHNKIGDFGSISISELLQEKTALKSLNLEDNGITAKGALYIANGLAKNTTLESLNLSSNRIGKAAPMTMSEREAAGMTKMETDYERNERNNADVLALARALETNTTLKLLNLENNKIEDFGQQTLKESFYVNSLLRKHYGMEPLQVIGVEPSIFDREKETALQERVRQIIAKKDEADRRPSAGEVEVRAISAAEAATSLAAGATGITSRHN